MATLRSVPETSYALHQRCNYFARFLESVLVAIRRLWKGAPELFKHDNEAFKSFNVRQCLQNNAIWLILYFRVN